MNEDLLQKLTEFGEEMQHAKREYEAKNDVWWYNLTEKERQDAFYAVCKRIYEGDLLKQGSYRYVLYDTFGFGPEMYGAGMDCGYMAIHNTLFEGKKLEKMHLVNRVELICETGREFTKYLSDSENIEYNLQDEGKTLKVFIQSN